MKKTTLAVLMALAGQAQAVPNGQQERRSPAQEKTTMIAKAPKALIVVTSHPRLGNTGKPTGYYLSEVTHPYFELIAAGIAVDFASPQGGKAPLDPNARDLSDEANRRFLEDPSLAGRLERTLPAEQINAADYSAILYAGGHGTMWDFPENTALSRAAASIYERGGVVAAVCHGPAALVNIGLSDGTFLVSGKRLTSFTNAEEEAAGLTAVMPFLLETRLRERGARFEGAANFSAHVVVSGRLVTGQNPASAAGVGKAMAELVRKSARP